MLDTRPLPLRADAAIRAAMCTAIPRARSVRLLDLARVYPRPALRARASRARPRSPTRIDRAAGPSNVAKMPSPAMSTSRPRKRATWARTRRSCLVEQFLPGAIPELRRLRRRADDVGEEEGGEHAIGLHVCLNTRQEALDLVEQRFSVTLPGEVVVSGQLDHTRPGNLLSHEARPLPEVLLRAEGDERGHGDRRQNVADVDLAFIRQRAATAPGLAPRMTYEMYQRRSLPSDKRSGATRPSHSFVTVDAQSSSSRPAKRFR